MFEIDDSNKLNNTTNFEYDYRQRRLDQQHDYQTFLLEFIAYKLAPGNLEFLAFQEQLRSKFDAAELQQE